MIFSLLLSLTALLAQDGETLDLYPAEPIEHRFHFFALEGRPDHEPLRKAMDKLGEEVDMFYGPVATTAVPKDHFVAVRAPLDVRVKDISKALKKGKAKPVELCWTMATWNLTEMPDIPSELGEAADAADQLRGVVVGSHGDLRWFELHGQHLLFFHEPGKVDGEWLADRLVKGLRPFAGEDFSIDLVSDTFEWTLAAEVDKSTAKKVSKALGKLDGVQSAELAEGSSTLRIRVALDAIFRSGPMGKYPPTEGIDQNVADLLQTGIEWRPVFDTTEVLEVLAKNELALAVVPKAGAVEAGADEGAGR